jgi:hypothetical protein
MERQSGKRLVLAPLRHLARLPNRRCLTASQPPGRSKGLVALMFVISTVSRPSTTR